jgi:SAM-dependent methyltransferase
MIEYIKEKMKGKFTNIYPVLVNAVGLDHFYKEHNFDIIFLCGVYHLIDEPVAYFKELKASLAKEGGRLYIVYYRYDSEFTSMEFGDFKKMVGILSAQGMNSPILKRLSRKNRSFIEHWNQQDIPCLIRKGILRDLNRIINDKSLLKDLSNYYQIKNNTPLPIHPNNCGIVKRLIMQLKKKEPVNRRNKWSFSNIDNKRLRKLNRFLLADILDSAINDIISGGGLEHIEEQDVLYAMGSAGYRLMREIGLLNYYGIMEFKRRD